MKKIGIMTWFHYDNYGSLLQAAATNYVLKEKKYKPIMINYRPKGSTKELKDRTYFINLFKNYFHKTSNINCNGKAFDEFRNKHFVETEELDDYMHLAQKSEEFDAIVCGSDQIWSPLCFDSHYYLDFAQRNKIVSYAPSFGSSSIKNPKISAQIKELLLRFDKISIREEQGQKIIKDLTGRESKLVLDPTLLLNAKEWQGFIKKVDIPKKPYIICYFLGNPDSHLETIEKYALSHNLEIYNIPFLENKKINKYNLNCDLGPGEFLDLMQNAHTIFTDSYHGTIFGINFNNNFYTFRRFKANDPKNQNSRILNILNKLDIMERLVDDDTNLDSVKKIDYKKVNKKLNEMRNESKEYLFSALDNLKNVEVEPDVKGKITNYCCGCGACHAVCPVNAIEIVDDEQGFQHYKINKEKCIECGMCRKVCPMLKLDTKSLKESPKLFSFKSKNDSTLLTSSSGGFSHTLATKLNKEGYYVCGACYDNKQDIAKHIIIKPNSPSELSKIQGSKYIQSHTKDAFAELMKLPKDAKVVVFATPCEIAGLDKLLKIKGKRENYILVDLICHGVPTKYLWEKYLPSIIGKHISSEHYVYFRNKSKSWRDKSMRMTIVYNNNNNNKYGKSEDKDNFYYFFSRGDCYMRSCFDCPYRESSSADIRIGDYWGQRFIKDTTGVSMVICNNTNAIKLVKSLKDEAKIEEHPLEEYWTGQFPTNQPIPIYREDLIQDLRNPKMSINKVKNKYYGYEELASKIAHVINIIRGRK